MSREIKHILRYASNAAVTQT